MVIHLSTFFTNAAALGLLAKPVEKYYLPDRQTITIAGKPDWKVEQEWKEQQEPQLLLLRLQKTKPTTTYQTPVIPSYPSNPLYQTPPETSEQRKAREDRYLRLNERYERLQDSRLPGRQSQTIPDTKTGLDFHCDQKDQDPSCPQTIPPIPSSIASNSAVPGLTTIFSHCKQQDVCEPGNGAGGIKSRQDGKALANNAVEFFRAKVAV